MATITPHKESVDPTILGLVCDPNMLEESDLADYNVLESQVFQAVYCLAHNATNEEPTEAMKSSQAALNLANALAVLDKLTKP